jgi:hypothetical protein
MGGGYGPEPQGVAALAQRLNALSNEIKTLRRSLNGIGLRVDGATDDLILGNGTGAVLVEQPDGTPNAWFGPLPSYLNRADGSPQYGEMFFREDGTVAAANADLNPTVAPFKQSFQILDRQSNIILADDTNGGIGLAVPLVPVPQMIDADATRWPQTTAGAFKQIGLCFLLKQNPGLYANFYVGCDAGTTGRVRLKVDGTVVATSPTATNSFAVWSFSYYWPAGWVFLSQSTLSLEAEVLSGSGSVYATPLLLSGVQSQ